MIIRLMTLAALAYFLFAPGTSQAQIYDCGLYDQRPCQRCMYLGDDVACGPKYCERSLTLSGNRCLIDRSGWVTKSIDDGRNRAQCQNINCWEYDDRIRDHLDMDPTHLTFTYTIANQGQMPPDGRYIYVYRKKDNQLVLRRYDRAHVDRGATCQSDANYRYQANYRGNTYLHVRHSQINGDWSPVWCAGELSIKGGRLWRLNNESGHFKPPATCLPYVENTFVGYGYRKASDFQSGDFNQVQATEVCGPPPTPAPGPDDHDEL